MLLPSFPGKLVHWHKYTPADSFAAAMNATYSLNLIFASVAAVYCLLGYWLAFGKHPWMWRAAAVCVALALMVPIRAYEPLVFFALTSLLFLAASGSWKLLAMARQRRTIDEDNPEIDKPSPAKPRFQFRIHDLLALMAVVGAAAFLVRVVLREQVLLPWIGTLISSAVAVTMTLSLFGLLRGPRRIVASVILVVVTGTSAWYFARLHRGGLFGPNVQYIVGADLGGQLFWNDTIPGQRMLVLLLTFLIFLAMFYVAARATLPHEEIPLRRRLWQSFGIAVCVVWFLPTTWLYWQLMSYPQPPSQIRDRPNVLPRLLERGQSLGSLTGAQARTVSAEVIELSKQPGFVAVPWEADLRERKNYDNDLLLDEVLTARSISRGLEAQIIAMETIDPNQAVEPLLACLRLGNMLEHEGLMVHGLVGYAIDGVGQSHLIRMRDKISISKIREIISLIESQEKSRDDGDVARDKLWYSLNDRWAFRLDQILHSAEVDGGNTSYRFYGLGNKRIRCITRLLLIDLALRTYHAEHGNFPPKMESLVPKYLSQVPLDPFVEKPFIYRLRDGGEFVLYSVGGDGVNNGGVFGPLAHIPGQWDGYDLSLDTLRE
ncbi:MAG: hypothetical protein K8R36_13840 [Planctomycetales bacterium]|nr:hypothetical protein [Planctomycetales bacterium]